MDCITPLFQGPSLQFDAFQACSDAEDSLLTPHSPQQNEVIRSLMIDNVCTKNYQMIKQLIYHIIDVI